MSRPFFGLVCRGHSRQELQSIFRGVFQDVFPYALSGHPLRTLPGPMVLPPQP